MILEMRGKKLQFLDQKFKQFPWSSASRDQQPRYNDLPKGAMSKPNDEQIEPEC